MEIIRPLYKQIKLTLAQEKELIKKYKQDQVLFSKAGEMLVCANIHLAYSFIKQHHINCNKEDIEDMLQTASRAILESVLTYDESVGATLCTHASYKVNECLTKYIFEVKNLIRLPKHMQTKLFKVNGLIKRNSDISDDEICSQLDLSSDKLYNLRNASTTAVRLNCSIDKDDSEGLESVDLIKSSYDGENPLAEMIEQERMNKYNEILKNILTPGEYDTFVRVNGLFGHEPEKVIDIAASRGLKEHSSVSNMLKRAVNKLRNSKEIGELSHRF